MNLNLIDAQRERKLLGFDQDKYLQRVWPGWNFSEQRLALYREDVAALNMRTATGGSRYVGRWRLKIKTPPFLTHEKDWGESLSGFVDVPAVRALVADLRAAHADLTVESLTECGLTDTLTRSLSIPSSWMQMFLKTSPVLSRIASAHTSVLCSTSDETANLLQCLSGIQASYSILRAGAVSQPHVGQFNTRLRLHYPLIIPSHGPEIAGELCTYGNAWASGPFILDDAQVHAVRNTGDSDRVILLFDIMRKDIPWILKNDSGQRRVLQSLHLSGVFK